MGTTASGDMKLFFGSAWLVAALMAAASGAGLFLDGIYRDNALVEAAWRGNDFVTLLLAVPLLAGSVLVARRGSGRGLLVSLGMLAYAAYNYAFYLFGAAFNTLFLVYVGVLASSTVGLIGGLSSHEIRPAAERIRPARRERMVGWLIIVVSLVLGVFWLATSVRFIVTGVVPAMVTATAHPTNVTGALDLWLVVTFGVLGGTWLVRGRGWGFIISAVWTVKGAVYMMALSAASVSAFVSGTTESLAQLALWLPIGAVCLVGAVVLLRSEGASQILG